MYLPIINFTAFIKMYYLIQALHDANAADYEMFIRMLLSLKMYERKENLKPLLNSMVDAIAREDEQFDVRIYFQNLCMDECIYFT